MNRKELSIEEINPYIRHIHLSGIEPFIQSKLLKAFDYRLFYIYDGKGYIMVSGRRYNVAKGNLFFWQPGLEYLIFSDPSHCMVIIGVNFDFTWNNCRLDKPISPEKSNVFCEDNIVEYIHFTDVNAFNEPIYIKEFQAFENILLEMNYEYISRKKYYIQRICGLFLSFISIVARYVSDASASHVPGFKNIDLILDYIHAHYNEPISNIEIGLKHNFHPNYINKLMVLHTGTSLHQYLINYRITKAANLMRISGKSITEIASNVGYEDISHFSKAFKMKMGESPKSFRAHSLGRI